MLVSGSIGGLLLSIVIIVVVVTCRRVQRSSSDISTNNSPQADRFSNSSNETKANTLSSAEDDLDGSDSLPEYHENYIKSKPDLLSPPVAPKPKYSYSSSNHTSYSNYSSRWDLLIQFHIWRSIQLPEVFNLVFSGTMITTLSTFRPPISPGWHILTTATPTTSTMTTLSTPSTPGPASPSTPMEDSMLLLRSCQWSVTSLLRMTSMNHLLELMCRFTQSASIELWTSVILVSCSPNK